MQRNVMYYPSLKTTGLITVLFLAFLAGPWTADKVRADTGDTVWYQILLNWEDPYEAAAQAAGGYRPASIYLDIYDGSQSDVLLRTVTVSGASDTYSSDRSGKTWFKNIALPKTDSHGHETSYTFRVRDGGLYSVSYPDGYVRTSSELGQVIVSGHNTITLHLDDAATLGIPFEKYWNDEGNETARPAQAAFRLIDTDTGRTIQTKSLASSDAIPGEDDHWEGRFTVPWAYYNKTQILEEAVQGYDTAYTVSGKTCTVINTYNTRSVSVDISWEDAGFEGERPGEIILDIADKDTPDLISKTVKVQISPENTVFTKTVSGIPRYDAGGEEIEYMVRQRAIKYYRQEYGDDGLSITNIYDDAEKILEMTNGAGSSDGYSTNITNKRETLLGDISITKKVSLDYYNDLEEKGMLAERGEFEFTLKGPDGYEETRAVSMAIPVRIEGGAGDGSVIMSADFRPLEMGEYRLYEDETGWFTLEDVLDIVNGELATDDDGQQCVRFNLTPDNASGMHGEATLINTIGRGSLKVKKVNGKDKDPIEGVEFKLTCPQNAEFNDIRGTTDRDGEISFGELPIGTYYLTEVRTRDGLTLLPDPVEIEIPMKLTPEEAARLRADTSKAVYSSKEGKWFFYDLTYEVSNPDGFKIPLTGGQMVWVFFAAGLSMVGAAVIRKMKPYTDVREKKGGKENEK